jgi:NAD(P)-dependent dehydrogenase (short-subunit alcohol dehydrogenase family)
MTPTQGSTGNAPQTLAGLRILISGGARGLGADFARACHAAGATVMIADILRERGEQTAGELGIGFVHLDLRDPASIEQCVARAIAQMGGLDGLVNCGAVTDSGGRLATEIEIDTWDRVMEVNVRGTWLMSREALPALRDSGRGRIVNIASDTALWGAPRLMAYVASKGAIIAMTRSLAREFGEAGIAVNAIAPGLTEVEATEYVPQARHDHYRNGRAMSRAQVPADVSGAVVFLLSAAAGFVTGQTLPVNGGFTFV